MITIPMVLRDGALAPEMNPLSIPDRIAVVMSGDVCTVYQKGDELPKPDPQRLLEGAKANALEQLRQRKWAAKDAGIVINGIAIDTDDKGQATINGAVTNVLLDPGFTATWKTNTVDADGQSVWVELDATMIKALSVALTRYTEACFAIEAVKQAEVVACTTIEEVQSWLAERLDTGWPG